MPDFFLKPCSAEFLTWYRLFISGMAKVQMDELVVKEVCSTSDESDSSESDSDEDEG